MTARAAWATDAAIENLRLWWPDRTISLSELERRLGVGKNQIIGKVHRLGLQSRLDPSERDRPCQPPPSRPQPAVKPVFTAPPPPNPTPIPRYGRVEPCCWVMTSASGGRMPLYCDADSVRGLPYCPDHSKRAVLVRQRAEPINVSAS